jgi:hypothetical protein
MLNKRWSGSYASNPPWHEARIRRQLCDRWDLYETKVLHRLPSQTYHSLRA